MSIRVLQKSRYPGLKFFFNYPAHTLMLFSKQRLLIIVGLYDLYDAICGWRPHDVWQCAWNSPHRMPYGNRRPQCLRLRPTLMKSIRECASTSYKPVRWPSPAWREKILLPRLVGARYRTAASLPASGVSYVPLAPVCSVCVIRYASYNTI